ncbi:minor tail protein [Gordonia phage BlingBling]|nr:minor tail protein [Gordonia phage BlingBling]
MADITYMTVTGLWTHIVDDGIVDGDPNPDVVHPMGKVVFAPKPSNTGFVTAGAAGASESVTLAEVPALVADGVLTDLQGNDGIRLAATIGGNPVRWVAQPTLLYGKKTLPSKSVTFDPPTVGTTLHLNDLFDDIGPQSPLVTTEVKAYRDQAVAARDEAQQLLDEVAAGVVPDSGVAARIADPESASGAAVDARIGAAGLLTQEDADAAYAPASVAADVAGKLDQSTADGRYAPTVDARVPASNLPVLFRTTDSQPFAADSIWNTPIGQGAAFEAAGAAATASFLSGAPALNDTLNGYGFYLNVARPADPIGVGSYVNSGGQTVTYTHRIPYDPVISGGSDGSMRVIDGRFAYDYWKTVKVDDFTYTADFITRTDLLGSGRNSGTRAARWPTAGGLIRAHEVSKCYIPHALALAIPASSLKRGFVWPASAEDATSLVYSGEVPMGSFFAIPPSVDLSTLNLSPEGFALAECLQNYGGYVGDQSASVAIAVEGEAAVVMRPAVERMRTDWNNTIFPALRRVTNVAEIAGGPGVRRVAAPGPVAIRTDYQETIIDVLAARLRVSSGALITSETCTTPVSPIGSTPTNVGLGGRAIAWAGFTDQFRIDTGNLKRIASPDGTPRAITLDVGAHNVRFECILTTRHAAGTFYLGAGAVDNSNTYRVAIPSNGSLSIQKVVGGGTAIPLQGTSAPAGIVPASGARVGIMVYGPTIYALINGEVVAEGSDSALQNGTRIVVLAPSDTTWAIRELTVRTVPRLFRKPRADA